MAMTFWGWEELPDDVLMKDKAYYQMWAWMLKTDQFTRLEYLSKCDLFSDGLVALNDASIWLKEMANELINSHNKHLSYDGTIYYITDHKTSNAVLTPDDIWYFRQRGMKRDTTEDAEVLALIEDERLDYRAVSWEELEELDYWQK